ncbi:hypothetical protein Tco_1420684 [Tanacetum coccineum]
MAFQWLPLRLAISKQEQALLVVSEVEGSLLFTSHLGLSAVYFPQLRHKINGVYAMCDQVQDFSVSLSHADLRSSAKGIRTTGATTISEIPQLDILGFGVQEDTDDTDRIVLNLSLRLRSLNWWTSGHGKRQQQSEFYQDSVRLLGGDHKVRYIPHQRGMLQLQHLTHLLSLYSFHQ